MTLGARKALVLINSACLLVASIAGLLSWRHHQHWPMRVLLVCTAINVFIILRYHAHGTIHDRWAKDGNLSISAK
jgi:hypothetical protein